MLRIKHPLRTLPPSLVEGVAESHDDAIWEVCAELFHILDQDSGDEHLHRISFGICKTQAALPLRLAGRGLRDSVRTSAATYWVSWAGSMELVSTGYPELEERMFHVA